MKQQALQEGQERATTQSSMTCANQQDPNNNFEAFASTYTNLAIWIGVTIQPSLGTS